MTKEFVVFDATGKECDWYDPYLTHTDLGGGAFLVELGHDEYFVEVPRSYRFEVREMSTQ